MSRQESGGRRKAPQSATRRGTWMGNDTLLTQSGTIMGSYSLIGRNGKEAAS
jgi:hypothetical protein